MLAFSAVPYKVPTYLGLAKSPRVDFTAIFSSSAGVRPYDNIGYSRKISWDSDLLGGYRSIFLRNADRTGLGGPFWSVPDADIVAVLTRGRFDVLWLDGYNSSTYLLAVLTQSLLGGKLLFREEQTTLHPRTLRTTILKEIALRTLLRGQHCLYISTENRRWFEHYGVPAERLWSAPYTVDNALLQAEAARLGTRKSELRRRFGIASDEGPVVLSVGRLVEKKQPHFTLEVFRRLREKHRCAMLFVGSGPLEPGLRDAVSKQNIPDVHFGGFLNQTRIAEAYVCADVFTLLSREHETFGVVVAEAMNFGLPVVVTDKVGCSADLVTPGHNGYVVPVGDPEAGSNALSLLVGDEHLRKRMGKASRDHIDDWPPQRTVDGILEACCAV